MRETLQDALREAPTLVELPRGPDDSVWRALAENLGGTEVTTYADADARAMAASAGLCDDLAGLVVRLANGDVFQLVVWPRG